MRRRSRVVSCASPSALLACLAVSSLTPALPAAEIVGHVSCRGLQSAGEALQTFYVGLGMDGLYDAGAVAESFLERVPEPARADVDADAPCGFLLLVDAVDGPSAWPFFRPQLDRRAARGPIPIAISAPDGLVVCAPSEAAAAEPLVRRAIFAYLATFEPGAGPPDGALLAARVEPRRAMIAEDGALTRRLQAARGMLALTRAVRSLVVVPRRGPGAWERGLAALAVAAPRVETLTLTVTLDDAAIVVVAHAALGPEVAASVHGAFARAPVWRASDLPQDAFLRVAGPLPRSWLDVADSPEGSAAPARAGADAAGDATPPGLLGAICVFRRAGEITLAWADAPRDPISDSTAPAVAARGADAGEAIRRVGAALKTHAPAASGGALEARLDLQAFLSGASPDASRASDVLTLRCGEESAGSVRAELRVDRAALAAAIPRVQLR